MEDQFEVPLNHRFNIGSGGNSSLFSASSGNLFFIYWWVNLCVIPSRRSSYCILVCFMSQVTHEDTPESFTTRPTFLTHRL